ncbi:MAG: DUF3551 domain-containing protein [Pseudomonadota bacterium]
MTVQKFCRQLQKAISMRHMILAVAALAAVSAFGTVPAVAQDYPFCRKAEAGPGDCRYDTMEQCQAAVSGISGYCQPNFNLAPADQTPSRRRAHRR